MYVQVLEIDTLSKPEAQSEVQRQTLRKQRVCVLLMSVYALCTHFRGR